MVIDELSMVYIPCRDVNNPFVLAQLSPVQ